MPDKKRERVYDKDTYKKKKQRKKKTETKKMDQAKSRDERNKARRQVISYYNLFKECENKSLLFVLKDTENMERILL